MTKRILIVEDDEPIRETLRFALESEGYEVFSAANGKEGIETLHTIPRPNLVFLDLMMPVMDGWGFSEELERDPKLRNIPVVVLTAFGEKSKPIKAKQLLRKPLNLDDLFEAVRRCSD